MTSSLVGANSPWSQWYFALRDSPVILQIGCFALSLDLQHWINDGLMAIFFRSVGDHTRTDLWRLVRIAQGGLACGDGVNAGVALSGDFIRQAFTSAVTLGVMAGLLIGKAVGATGVAWLAVRLGWAVLSGGVGWRHIVGAAMIGGVGFTVALFIAGLAFTKNILVEEAKVGVLFASLIAALGGYLFLLLVGREQTKASNMAPIMKCNGLVLRALLLASVCSVLTSTVMAQEPVGKAGEPQKLFAPGKEGLSLAPAKVDVNPVARDEEIRQRLQSVLDATEWFIAPEVRVQEGVVFLKGRVASDDLKKWAGDLARNTQDVVAVANRMEVADPSPWDLGPAWSGLLALWRDIIRSLPLLVLGLLILALSVGIGLLATRGARAFLRQRIRAQLLRNVLADGIGVLVFLFGTYIVLRVSGLTQLALTVVGGTGLIGLAVGIAFRDITENFLASIFLSIQRPFETGDLVEVSGVTGYVQQLNVRTTILMALDGNLVQIPNASVYKSNLRNFTTNSNRREDFIVGIGYDDSINEAQEIARNVLANHPAVLKDPEPSVLADSLGKATVNLRVYFWINGREHSWLKVRSSVLRLVKRAFQKHGISMPDEAREVVFPQGIPVTMLDEKPGETHAVRPGKHLPPGDVPPEELDAVSTKAEAGLYSEAGVLEEQARQSQSLQEGENLLPAASGPPSSEEHR